MSAKSLAVSRLGFLHPNNAREKVTHILNFADIIIGGSRPWDIRIHDERFFSRVLVDGSLGLGEAYMDGWWDCDRLDELFNKVLRADLQSKVKPWEQRALELKAKLFNRQNPVRAHEVGKRHYDIGNDLYQLMLDQRMIYSCGYWHQAATLDEAQEAKLDLVCRKLHLEPGMRVLDIGCGWGGAAKFAAERYGVKGVGVTVSREQEKTARELCQGLPVEIHLQDYRDIKGVFDRVYSIGMFEHVGYKNYLAYMQVVANCLKKDGLSLLHTIGANTSYISNDAWAERYIFPNSMLPSHQQIATAAEGQFVIEDWHNFGPDYDKTLLHWWENFETNWASLKGSYDERFHRMWRYYLLTFAGAFRARYNQLWQIVMSPKGAPARYHAPR
jgi:cyclopropane-fatty-acyl-phospholipid synthase